MVLIPTLLFELSTCKVFVSTVRSAGKVTLLLASSITAFEAGRVQNTFLVPAEKLTNASELEEEITVVLANVPAAIVPRPTSNSVVLGISIA